MNYPEAKKIVEKYIDAVASGTPNNGIARFQSLLPCSKEQIFDAFKIFLSHSMLVNRLPEDIFYKYLNVLWCINQFVKDEEAEIVNKMHVLWKLVSVIEFPDRAQILYSFREKMITLNEKEEMSRFLEATYDLDIDDPVFCKKIYDLAGIKYYPDYDQYFMKQE